MVLTAMQSANSKSCNHLEAITLAAKEFNVDTKYVDLVIRVSLCFAEACRVQTKGF